MGYGMSNTVPVADKLVESRVISHFRALRAPQGFFYEKDDEKRGPAWAPLGAISRP